ncbi:uncharacterized protein FIBRA_08967 [Fibroporia radiculosa]|uniref:Uncharacterized protein n=1 Tax=Fibroporia radiculosa TaxID=599839 RepID=J4I3L5_9APHY|nr:uncharacterized protein FIBRA_08967 [Fibroporia radiculosa]CCM06682.1 predicted protein [Fibroporia radiculosa]
MPLQSSANLTRQERLAQRLASDPALKAHYNSSLDKHHIKTLSRPAVRTHERIRKYWAEYVDTVEDGGLSRDIVIGAKRPPLEHCKGFVRWMSMSLKGAVNRRSTFISVRSLTMYAAVFLACWPRYANIFISKEYRYQVLSYINGDLIAAVSIPSAMRAKPIAETVDVTIVIDACWNDTTHFRTNRMRLQLIFGVDFISITAERSGGVVESSCYLGTNEALVYGDFEFWWVPRKDDPYHPLLVILGGIGKLKGGRQNEAMRREFFLFLQGLAQRAYCSSTLLYTLGIEDKIFMDVSSMAEIVTPKVPVTKPLKLRIHPDKKKLLIMRDEEYDQENKKWVISKTRALPYMRFTKHIRIMCLRAGFESHITPHCLRRGQANKVNLQVTEAERNLIMGHTPHSSVFHNAYASRTSTVDLASIFFRESQDATRVKIMQICSVHSAMACSHNKAKTILSMSRNRDLNAPVELPFEERQKLLDEPELVEMLERRQMLLVQVAELEQTLGHGHDEEIECEMCALEEEAAVVLRNYNTTIERETRVRLELVRAQYFDEASYRAINGITSARTTGMAAQKLHDILPSGVGVKGPNDWDQEFN